MGGARVAAAPVGEVGVRVGEARVVAAAAASWGAAATVATVAADIGPQVSLAVE